MSATAGDKARLITALRDLISSSPAVRAAAEREWLTVPLAERERVRASLMRAKRESGMALDEAQRKAARLRAAAGKN